MINASGFKYTSDSQGVCDMVISLNNGVVSDGTHKNPLTKFNPVVITSQHDGRQYAAVGFATGEIDSRSASEIWPNWAGDNTVHRVDFLDRLFELPEGMFKLGGSSLPLHTVEKIATWALAQ
jgi:hypothetical protein